MGWTQVCMVRVRELTAAHYAVQPSLIIVAGLLVKDGVVTLKKA